MRNPIVALLLLCACALAEGPSAVAIRNARIFPVAGPPIAKGTAVLENGLIEAAGENVTPPPDAWVIEGEGLTVYPGLIDCLSTAGMPGAAGAATAAGRGGRSQTTAVPAATPVAISALAPSRGPEDRPSTTSWLVAADEIQPADRRIETVRGAGITTAAVFPTRGIFAGQGSLVDFVSGEQTAILYGGARLTGPKPPLC